MANTLPFKCYLLTNNEQDKEIRRFTLESDVVGNFLYLKEKIRSVYPQLLRENFYISYVDEEGDKVTISSDDELVAALMYGKRNLEPFRLFVQVTGGTKPEAVSPPTESPGNCQGEVHWGVTCDGCQGAVKGFRYKCLQCPDFDLCGMCETAGQHRGHTLIRVTGGMPASFQAMRNLLNGGAEVPHWRKKHHGRFHHQGHHGWNAGCPSGFNAEAHSSTAAAGCNKGANKPDSKPQCPYKFYVDQAKETASTFQANHPEYLSGLSNSIASVMEGLGLGFGGVVGSCPRAPAPQSERKKEERTKEGMKAEPKNTEAEAKKEVIVPVIVEDHASPTSAPVILEDDALRAPISARNTNPYAQLVDAIAAARAVETASAVAAAHKHAEAVAITETAPKGNSPFVMSSQSGIAAPAPSRAVAEAVAETAALASSQAVTEAVAEAAASAPPQIVADVVAKAAASAPPQIVADVIAKAAADSASQTAGFEVTIAATAAADSDSSIREQNADEAAAPFKPRSRRGDSGDWTIVDHGTETPSSVVETSLKPSAQSEGARPKDQTEPVSLLEKAPSHPDPFIAAALETMLAMGFTNEGGWLAQLLEVKGGDIGKTLDVLQSQFQRQRQEF